jgi:hypothetical protein
MFLGELIVLVLVALIEEEDDFVVFEAMRNIPTDA